MRKRPRRRWTPRLPPSSRWPRSAPASQPERGARARFFGTLFGPEATVGAFGRFWVLERLGAGGMGVVYGAYDPDLARGVALKRVDVTAKDRQTALAEAKALARLSHPNVVPIYDVGLERDHVYLVMELVRGRTLRQWSQDHGLREILEVYRRAGVALAAAPDVGHLRQATEITRRATSPGQPCGLGLRRGASGRGARRCRAIARLPWSTRAPASDGDTALLPYSLGTYWLQRFALVSILQI